MSGHEDTAAAFSPDVEQEPRMQIRPPLLASRIPAPPSHAGSVSPHAQAVRP
jgi:hypothetical protein